MGFFSDLKEDLSQAVNELKQDSDTKKEPEVASDPIMETAQYEALEKEMETLLNSEELDKVSDDIILEAEDLPDLKEESIEVNTVEEVIPVETEAPSVAPVEPQYEAPKTVSQITPPVSTRTASDEVSVIMESMIINGNMATEGSLEIHGAVVGNVEALGKLNITGSVQGDSSAAEIFAENARITGEVKSMGTIKVGQSTVIIGNVYATSAVIAGAVKGDIDVKGPVILDSSAIVMGNIKSKSVQINNGAVIEGMCSQCYAEVNPTSFFEELKKMK